MRLLQNGYQQQASSPYDVGTTQVCHYIPIPYAQENGAFQRSLPQ